MLATRTRLSAPITCTECNFTSSDLYLVQNHSCVTASNGGRCEDYPCCGHEAGDCNGQLYGSDESIKEQVEVAWRTGHGHCDHADGLYNCDDMGDEPDEDEDEDEIVLGRSYSHRDNDDWI